MSKNIIIQEGGIGKQLTADKLKTDLVGGGTCLWVPEDGTQLGTKYITENGTYRARDEGLYGYSEVTVSGIGTATGTGPDGEDHSYSEDGEGGVTDTVLPASISVITPPTVTTYLDGATIDFSGMVVKGFLKSGGAWSDTAHPDGVIPISELILPVTIADGDDAHSGEWSDGHGVNAVMIYFTQHWDLDYRDREYSVYADVSTVIGYDEGEPIYLKGQGPGTLLATRYKGMVGGKLIAGDNSFDYTHYDPSKETYKFYGGGTTSYTTNTEQFTLTTAFADLYTALPESTSDPRQAGEMQPISVSQNIPVQFLRSDGKTLETSFDITVT